MIGARPPDAPPSGLIGASRSDKVFWILLVNLSLVALLVRSNTTGVWPDAINTWITVAIALVVQAVPFLVLGVVLAGLINAARPGWLARALPQRLAFSVPAAGLAGALLPGCECSSVPIARRLIGQGVPAAGALTFLLASPAINPVVLVATAVAFPGSPRVVLARFVASLAAAIAVGYVWGRKGRDEWLRNVPTPAEDAGSFRSRFLATVEHDFLHAGGYLVIGAVTAATFKVALPAGTIDSVAGRGAISVIALSLLAVLLSVCSEADAFIAASFTQFSMTARLVFMVVGPMVDMKLIAMQAGVFGRPFAARFAPLAFVAAILSSVATARILL